MTHFSGAGSMAGRVQELLRRHPFDCHRWLRNGHLQTIVGSRQRRRFDWGWSTSRRESISIADGTRIEATWVEVAPDAPTLVVVHGMAGSSRSTYMLGLSHKAYRRGWNTLLPDLYDRSGAARIFHAGSSRAVAEIISVFRSTRRLGDVVVVGVSMGGNIVLKLAGEAGNSPPKWLRGIGVISPLADLTFSGHLMNRKSNRIYRQYYVRRLKQLALNNLVPFHRSIDPERLRRVRSTREFDETVTVPVAGFADVREYYREASARPVLPGISVPTFAIHSRDDPFLPAEPLLDRTLAEHPFLNVAMTDRGGHVAFIEDRRVDLDRSWAENRLIDFLDLILG